MMPGEIVLLRMPQPDLLPGKLRPVLVLAALPVRSVMSWCVAFHRSYIKRYRSGMNG